MALSAGSLDRIIIQQIAQDNDITPSLVITWKWELEERMVELFNNKSKADQKAKDEATTARLERKVG